MKQVLHRMTAVITLLSMIAMMIVAAGLTVSAAEGGRLTDTMTWSLENGVLRIEGTGDMPDYSESIKSPWYLYNEAIKEVVITDGVIGIGDWAFLHCHELESVTIPEGVTSIGDYAFCNCSSLASIEIPESVTSIGASAFFDCSRLTDAIYRGTKEQWSKVNVGIDNENLLEVLRFTASGLPGDVNDDGKVNSTDRTYLARHLAGWEGYTL